MVSFKFTKKNGLASVGTVKKVPAKLAKIYSKLGLGITVEEVKEKPKKASKKTKKD